jgi:hypothetical protein
MTNLVESVGADQGWHSVMVATLGQSPSLDSEQPAATLPLLRTPTLPLLPLF